MQFNAKSVGAHLPMKNLGALTFPDATAAPPNVITEILTANRPPKNVGIIPGSKITRAQHQKTAPLYAVRLFLNQQRLTLALRPMHEKLEAARLADAALLYFWKYRIRGGPVPAPDLFNISVEQARIDQNNVTGLFEALVDLEVAWQADGLLPSLEELKERKEQGSKPRVMTSLRKKVDAFPELISKLEVKLETVSSQVEAHGATLEKVEALFKQLVEAVTKLAAK